MAKQAAPAAATVTDAPVNGTSTATPFPKANALSGASTLDVVKWGNGEVVSEHVAVIGPDGEPTEVTEPAAKPTEAKPGAEEAAPEADDTTPAETPSGKEKAQPEEGEEEAAKPAAPNAERRAQIVASLKAERDKRAMETQIATAKKEAEDAKAAQAAFDKLPLAKQIEHIARVRGMTVEDVKDRLLIGADEAEVPAAAKPVDPELAALRAEVAELKKHRETEAESAARANTERAVGIVRTTLGDKAPALVEALDAYDRVMITAHEAWMAGGRKGHPTDYAHDAAALVEDELKAERPKLAARLYPKTEAAAVEEGEEAPAAPAPRVAVGKRTAARPDAKPKSIWEGGRTTAEVDAEIKKQYGW